MSEPIIILGASARAAAQSAARAGYSPWAADLFADADLARLCPVHRIDRFPCDLVAAARLAPPGNWMYTGGLENYPRVVERIAAARPLYGNPGAILRRVRDPWKLAQISERVGLPFPQMSLSGEGLPKNGSWLRKGLRSSGGLRVETWDEQNRAATEFRGWYFQERIAGDSHAAVYVGDGRTSQLLGITRQFVGGDAELGSIAGAPLFHYAGSVGPVRVSEKCRGQLNALGGALADEFQLVGLFGVDFVFDGRDPCPIEINPRFPASVEVLERAFALTAVGLHVAACRDKRLPDRVTWGATEQISGKAILYAEAPLSLNARAYEVLLSMNPSVGLPRVSDIPAAAADFRVGEPIVTLLADGGSVAEVQQFLAVQLRELRSHLERLADTRAPS